MNIDYIYDGERYKLDLEIERILKARKVRDIVEELSRTPPEVEVPKPREYIEERLTTIRSSLRHLEQEVELRRDLHNESVEEINYQILKAQTSLKEFKFWGLGYNRGVDAKRNLLERELSNLRRERRRVKVSAWEDISSLRRSWRELYREYKSLMARQELVD